MPIEQMLGESTHSMSTCVRLREPDPIGTASFSDPSKGRCAGNAAFTGPSLVQKASPLQARSSGQEAAPQSCGAFVTALSVPDSPILS